MVQQPIDDIPAPTRLLRSQGQTLSATLTKVGIPESKIPIKSLSKSIHDNERLIETLRTMADNLTLALNTPSKRLSSQFRTPSTLKF